MAEAHKNMPERGEIAKYWNEYIFSNGSTDEYPIYMWIDIGEPVCWACGGGDKTNIIEYREKKYQKYPEIRRKDEMNDVIEMWNKTKFHRHHIVPQSRGGSNKCSNFLLLCNECHEDIPHIIDIDIVFKWMKNRRNELANNYINIFKSGFKLNNMKYDVKIAQVIFNILMCEQNPLHQDYWSYISTNSAVNFLSKDCIGLHQDVILALKYYKQIKSKANTL